jgi:iron-sulfur cluster repair protein YtfE (RIC family)
MTDAAMKNSAGDDVLIASNAAEAAAVAAVEQHHAQLAGALALRVETLLNSVACGDPAADRERRELVDWCHRELVPHALAEEKALYPAAHAKAEARLLVDGMLDEHRVITGLVGDISTASEPVRAAAASHALRVMFTAHLTKENQLILPLLAAAPEVALVDLLAGMHELLGGHASE